jgi:cholesterol oxidase
VSADHRSVSTADRTSLSFTEEMKGYYANGVSGPRAGDVTGRRLGQRFRFRLTITVDDVDRFLADPEHTARAEGWIDAAACGGRRRVQRGWFNLFTVAEATDRRLMRYRLHFTDDMGQLRTLTGWKNVVHGPLTDIWPDTSTLYFRILEGHIMEDGDDTAAIVGAGMLHIQVADFVRQLTTFRAHGPHGLAALERFGTFFAGRLWDIYRPQRGGPPATRSPPIEPSPVAGQSPLMEQSPTAERWPAIEPSPTAEQSPTAERWPAVEQSPTMERTGLWGHGAAKGSWALRQTW